MPNTTDSRTLWLTHDHEMTVEHVGLEHYWQAWTTSNPHRWYRGATEQEALAVLRWVLNTESLVDGFLTLEESKRLVQGTQLIEVS